MITEQTLHLLKVILKQNYFQYKNQFFQPEKCIVMGSPISSTITEIYLQFLEEMSIKQWLESKEIIYYKRHVDDFLIIFDQNKTDGKKIMNHVSNIDKHLEFKLSEEENTTIKYLDLSNHRNTNSIDRGIYRKPTHTDVTIQFFF
jgi:DNA integrity scanning protein DisA with diadenylate cyclase activity